MACWLEKTFWPDPEHVEFSVQTPLETKLLMYRLHLQNRPPELWVKDLKRWVGAETDFYDYVTFNENCFQGTGSEVRTSPKD